MQSFNVYEILDRHGNSTGRREKIPVAAANVIIPTALQALRHDQKGANSGTFRDPAEPARASVPVAARAVPSVGPAAPPRRPPAFGNPHAQAAALMAEADASAAARQPLDEAGWRQIFSANRVSGAPPPAIDSAIDSATAQAMWAQAFAAAIPALPRAGGRRSDDFKAEICALPPADEPASIGQVAGPAHQRAWAEAFAASGC